MTETHPQIVRKLGSSLKKSISSIIVSLLFGGLASAAPLTITLPANSTGAAIQKALDAAQPHGEVILSPGTYTISSPLFLQHDYVTLRGSGTNTILRLADKANCPVVILAPVLTQIHQPAAHLRLADLYIDGNRKNQTSEFWKSAGDGSMINNNGIQIWNVTDADVDNVICGHCRSGGLVTASVRRLQLSGYGAFDNEFDGLACYETEDSRFSGLHLHDNQAAGISLDLAFNHNVITNSVLADNDLGIFMRDSRNNSFQGLTITKSRHHGVFLAQAAAPTAKGWELTPGTECTGNNFEKLNITGCGGDAFLVNDASCTNNIVAGALFTSNARDQLAEPVLHLISITGLITK